MHASKNALLSTSNLHFVIIYTCTFFHTTITKVVTFTPFYLPTSCTATHSQTPELLSKNEHTHIVISTAEVSSVFWQVICLLGRDKIGSGVCMLYVMCVRYVRVCECVNLIVCGHDFLCCCACAFCNLFSALIVDSG